MYCTCIIQLLDVGHGCPKYDEARKNAFETDSVKKFEKKNKVSYVSTALTRVQLVQLAPVCIVYCVLIIKQPLMLSINYILYWTASLMR